jgi:hypothetical protein
MTAFGWQRFALALALSVAAPGAARAQGTADTSPAAKLDALNAALDSGLITRAEYDARIDALARGASASPAAPASPFEAMRGPGGGHMLIGSLGAQDSLEAAAAAALRRVHAEFGERPQVTRLAQNPATGSAVLFFTAARAGQPVTGLAMLNGAPGGQASVAVLYDSTRDFPISVGPMLRQLHGGADPASPAARLAPAEPMQRQSFADGTGSIDLPADWRLLSGGGGSVAAIGPTGEVVSYNSVLTGMDPNNPKAQQYLRTMPAQVLNSRRQSMAVVPYTADPVQAFNALFRQLAAQNGKPPPGLVVRRSTPIGAEQGLHIAEMEGDGTFPGVPGKADDAPGIFIGYVQVTPPDPMGQWTLYTTLCFVPKAEAARQAATALAVLGSVRINFQAVGAISAATRAMFQKQFEGMIQSARDQDAARAKQGQDFMTRMGEHQEQMTRAAVAMENYVLDRRVVVDTETGARGTIDAGLADALVHVDPRFELVPPSRLLRGVDY